MKNLEKEIKRLDKRIDEVEETSKRITSADYVILLASMEQLEIKINSALSEIDDKWSFLVKVEIETKKRMNKAFAKFCERMKVGEK